MVIRGGVSGLHGSTGTNSGYNANSGPSGTHDWEQQQGEAVSASIWQLQ
jgi:hypothetical protein